MQYTTNYSLKKPQYADEADIEVINDNTDDVDTLIHQNRTMIAPAFDNTKAYVTGDPVEYLGALYVFTSDKAAGAWDASKVEPTTAAEMGGGGTSALADLDDVEITSPTDGQALLFDDSDDKWKNQTLPDASVTKTATGNPIEITDAASAPLVKCVTAITGYQDGTGTPSPDNIRPITAYTEGEIVVSDGDGNVTTHTATFSQSIYQGNADFIGGTMVTPLKVVDMGDIPWAYNAQYNYFEANLYVLKKYANNVKPNMYCECYAVINSRYGSAMGGAANGIICPRTDQSYIQVKETAYMDATQFRNSVTGMKLVYELATPTTSSVTPTNLPIRSLSGYTHIESSTGEMEIEYITKGEQALVDLIEKSDRIYSTQEQVVGTWVDGKTLYEKTLTFTTGAANTYVQVAHNISNVDTIWCTADSFVTHNGFTFFLSAYTGASYDNDFVGLVCATTFDYRVGVNLAGEPAVVTLRYTKTSSTRSLSKGGGEQEVKEEPTEETKEEPKEETKEENENNEAER